MVKCNIDLIILSWIEESKIARKGAEKALICNKKKWIKQDF